MSRNKTLRQVGAVLETGNLLWLRLLLKNRAGARVFPSKVFREYMGLAGRGRWLSRSIFQVFPEFTDTRVTVEHLPGEGIGTPADELMYLALITKAVAPRRIFEIGTFRGRTALNFALNSPADCVVYTLDLPPASRSVVEGEANIADATLIGASDPGVDYRNKDVAGKIHQLYGNSLHFDFHAYRRQMGIVFVDGAHHYEAAMSDTRAALEMVAPGGVVVWHDFANYGDYHDVTRAVLDCLPGDRVVQIESSQLALYRSVSS